MNYFVTGIGTDVGKTLVSAIVVEALGLDYWKPIQSGLPRDTATVRELVSRRDVMFHKEAYLLNTPASPHASAKIDGVEIKLGDIHLPDTQNGVLVEGAGGLMVPVNDDEFVVDIAGRLDLEVILVANFYLGSINHTLLSFELLKQRGYTVKGIIFSGEKNVESEQVIMKQAWFPSLLHVEEEPEINKEVVAKYASVLRKNWKKGNE